MKKTDNVFAELTAEKEFNKQKSLLTYCNDVFIKSLYKVFNICKFLLSNFFRNNISYILYYYVKKYVQFSFMCNNKDEIEYFIINQVSQLCIFTFCKNIKILLSGKVTKMSDKTCNLFKQAYEINRKRRKFSK